MSHVFGNILVFTPIFTNICMMISDMSQIDISLKYSSDWLGIFLRVYHISALYNDKRIRDHKNPVSSANAEKIKSDCASGI